MQSHRHHSIVASAEQYARIGRSPLPTPGVPRYAPRAMSEKRTYNIRCPKCGHEQAVELHDSVNVKEQPELREALMRNQLNAIACTACSFAFRVDKQLIYSDPGHRLLIFWVPAEEAAYEADEDKFVDMLGEVTKVLPDDVEAPSVHLVFSRTELIELIFLKEAGLDERIIEYIKYTMFTKNQAKLDPTAKTLLFNAHDSNDTQLCFVVQDVQSRKFEAVLNYARESYNALKETFGDEDKSFDLLELFPGPYISARHTLLREMKMEEPLDGGEPDDTADADAEPDEDGEDLR